MSQLMSAREVSRRYGIPYDELKRDLAEGLAPHIRVGKGQAKTHRRMYPEQVQRYLTAKEAMALATPAPEPQPADPELEAIQATRARQRRRTGHRRPY